MIITCNKCSTSFNLDDSLIKEEGSKCRCSVCKHIFTAYPLPGEPGEPELMPGSEELSSPNLESDPDNVDGDTFEESSDFEIEESDFSFEEDSDLEIESSDFDSDFEMDDTNLKLEKSDLDQEELDLDQEESDLEIDEDFSFDDSELEIDEDDESHGLELEDNIEFDEEPEEDLDSIEFESFEDEPVEDEPVSFDIEETELALEKDEEVDENIEEGLLDGEEEDDDDEFELEFDVENDYEDKISDIVDETADEPPLEIETDFEKESSTLSLEEEEKAEEDDQPVITPEEDFSEYDEVLEQETEPEDDSLEEETIEIEDTYEEETLTDEPKQLIDKTPRSRIKKRKSLIGIPGLLLLLLFFLVFGAYIASIMTGYKIPYLSDIKIPFIEQYRKKPIPEISETKPVPNQKSVNGRFVTNSTAGTLFVITGRVDNPSNTAYSHIEIRGALIAKNKEEAKTKNAFCGNIITEEMLKTGNISDINKLLATKKGKHNTNVNVKPKASIPFMVVFSDLPEKLQNFTVKVTNFEKSID